MIEIRRLDAGEVRVHLGGLAEVLHQCVKSGASVGFVEPFGVAMAEEFFAKLVAGVESGERILLAAFAGELVVGTVQVVMAPMPNQPHRADVAKLLVHPVVRGQGVAATLMQEVERQALQSGRTLLTLDTVTGSVADRLYTRLGWNRAGIIPDYAVFPDGRFCDTTIFWKKIG